MTNAATYARVWVALLALTAGEIALLWAHLAPRSMLALLLAMSVVKAALIMAWFMHLRFERLRLAVAIVATLLVFIGALLGVLPESYRVLELGAR